MYKMELYNSLLPVRQLNHKLKKQQEQNSVLLKKLSEIKLELRTVKARAKAEQKRKLELLKINKNLTKGYKELIEKTRNNQLIFKQ